uniref:DUF3399 domain-containing protein n=1 Tax=Steinernema glaseri TaxID=37863 RepID=A0A1I8A9L8_9BILA
MPQRGPPQWRLHPADHWHTSISYSGNQLRITQTKSSLSAIFRHSDLVDRERHDAAMKECEVMFQKNTEFLISAQPTGPLHAQKARFAELHRIKRKKAHLMSV